MSSTRRSPGGGPIRQERYASSAGFAKGLLGNLVAKRAATLRDTKERELIYFLHELSLREGHALHYTCNLFPAWPEHIPALERESIFESAATWLVCGEGPYPGWSQERMDHVRAALPDLLTRLCLDPELDLHSCLLSGYPGLISDLHRFKKVFEAPSPNVAVTSVTKMIHELLDYALTQRGMVLAEGTYRAGKSMAAQSWAQQHLGQCRYVQLTSSNDETSFIRCFARALGVACSPQMKATQMRNRVEEVLRRQHLLIIIDEADYCLDGAVKVREAPRRINWLMTALQNAGTPLAMIASANFSRMLQHLERRCPTWGSEQFHGRIKLRRRLPDNLEEEDLFGIAAVLLPEADEPTRMLLVGHAMRSAGYVAALESAAERAKFFAAQAGRAVCFDDMERVMIEAGTTKAQEPSPDVQPAPAAETPRSPRGSSAAPSRKARAQASRVPREALGALPGLEDFTGTRLPGSLP